MATKLELKEMEGTPSKEKALKQIKGIVAGIVKTFNALFPETNKQITSDALTELVSKTFEAGYEVGRYEGLKEGIELGETTSWEEAFQGGYNKALADRGLIANYQSEKAGH